MIRNINQDKFTKVTRDPYVEATVRDIITISTHYEIQNFKINQKADNEGVWIGQVIPRQLLLTLIVDTIEYSIDVGDKIVVNQGVIEDEDKYLQNSGTFYVDSVVKKEESNVIDIIAYDRLKRGQSKYAPPISYPTTVKDLVSRLAEHIGLDVKVGDLDLIGDLEIVKKPYFGEGVKVNDILIAVAQANISFVYLDVDQTIRFRRTHQTNYDINSSSAFRYRKKEGKALWDSVLIKDTFSDNEEIRYSEKANRDYPNLLTIINNPIINMYEDFNIGNILNVLKNISYPEIEEFTIQSNPTLEIGDIITFDNDEILILEIETTLTRSVIKTLVSNNHVVDYSKIKGIELKVDYVIGNINKKLADQEAKITQVGITADEKNNIYYGESAPEGKKSGDIWFQKLEDSEARMSIWNGVKWENVIDKNQLEDLRQEIKENTRIVEQTKLNADEEIKKVKESISSLNNGLTQKYNNIESSLETYVKEEALISGIKQRAGNIFLFSSDGKRINGIRITPDNTYISNGVIKNAHIADASITNAKIADIRAEKIKAGTIDFNKIRGINIDASNITTGSMSANRITAGILRGNKSEYNLNDGVIRTWSISQDRYSKITNGTISLENYNGKNRMTLIDTGITFHNNNDRVGYLEVVSNDAISLAHQKKKYLAITGNNSYGNEEQYVYFDMSNILGTRDTNYPIKFMKSVYMFEYFRVAKNAHFQSNVYTYNKIFLNDGAKQNRFTIKTLTGFSAGDGKMTFYGNGNVNSGIGVDYNGDVWIIKNGLGVKKLS